MQALFVELPAFARHRADYLDDEELRGLQNALLDNPEAGDVIARARVGCARYATLIRGAAKANAAVFALFTSGGARGISSGSTRSTTRTRSTI